MITLKKTAFFTLIFLIVAPVVTRAQGGEEGSIEDEEIVIRKDRRIVLPAAIRNFEKIPQVPLRKASGELNYTFRDFTFSGLQPTIPTFRAAGLRLNEAQQEVTGNYVKAGYGNYNTPYLEAYLGSLRSKSYLFNVFARHLSSKNGPVFDENSGSGNTDISVGGKFFNDINTISGTAKYSSAKTHFYGYNPVLELSSGDIEQKFSHFAAQIGIEKTNKEEQADYHLFTDWGFFKDDLNAKENQFAFDLGVGYKANDQLSLRLDGKVIFSKREDAVSTNRNYFNIQPRVMYSGENFRITAGANIADDNDDLPTAQDADEDLLIFPYARIDISLGKTLSFYGGYEGDLQMNSFYSFAQENPWLQADFTLFNTEKESDIFAGVEADLSKGVRLGAGFSAASLKRLPFFTNGSGPVSFVNDSTKFEVLYEMDAFDRLNLFSEISYEKPKVIRSSLRFDYFNYELQILNSAYHRPEYQATLSATAFPIENLTVTGDFYYVGGLTGLNGQTNVETALDDIADLNLSGNYALNEQFSVFLQLNNVFGTEYQRYLNYANRGIQFLGGITLSF